MAKKRYISDSIWSDTWIEELEQDETFLFLYLLTNERVSICGIYEINKRRMSFETKIEIKRIDEILEKFERDEKVFYRDGMVFIVNFVKNQEIKTTSDNLWKGIEREIKTLGRVKIEKFAPCKPLVRVVKSIYDPLPIPYLTLLNFTSNEDAHFFGKKYKSEKSQEEKTDEVLGDAENPENSRFNDFWEKFPKKKNKQKAQEEFALLTAEEQSLACDTIEKHTKYWKKQQIAEQFIPYPDTWLANKRWQDEIETEAEKQAKARARREEEKEKLEAEKAKQEAKIDEELRNFFAKLPDEKKQEIETEAEKSARKLLPKAKESAIHQMTKSNIRKLTKTAYEQANSS